MSIYLGENENCRVIKANLRDVKHLLIVGKTGTGKTETFNDVLMIKRSKNG